MRNTATFLRPCTGFLILAALASPASAQVAAHSRDENKLSPPVRARAARGRGWSRIILRTVDSTSLQTVVPVIERAGGRAGRQLGILNGQTAYVPNAALAHLASSPLVEHVWLDRPVAGALERTSMSVGAAAVRQELGYDGSGIGVAIIDSGVTSWHDDLTGGNGQRVDRFVDLVNGRETAYDDYGHGTHVAGIIAGNGFDSDGARVGIAPGAHLIVLKTLDSTGAGRISDVIAALDYVVANKDALNIRVVNLSVAAEVHESYDSDPLTLAAKRAVTAGIVVVAAAGNAGRDPLGRTQYGGIMAPGNAPWVLTVGASSHMGTVDPTDDTIAAFSSRGPTPVNYAAKPDVVAPGVGIESLSDPLSALYTTKSPYLLGGTVAASYLPYLSLSGTSAAAPVVSGTVALMIHANPALTPNAVKAILEYTSIHHEGSDTLTQGAGFLNAKGAVELAHFFAEPSTTAYPPSSDWGAQLLWANHRIGGGRLMPTANAWATDVTWGAPVAADGASVKWGVSCATTSCDADGSSTPWGVACSDAACTTATWGVGDSPNIVWGMLCGGADCQESWTLTTGGAALLSTTDVETVVWATGEAETVVWATAEEDTVVWATLDEDTSVWGTSCTDPSCEPVMWKKNDQ
ncbi:MAG TPA: S8 family peptidase [Vicinamibacterales bacterium]|jgi:serine protease AprX|nr:S8 family peptidase [Vicinamibacterales bacterium]